MSVVHRGYLRSIFSECRPDIHVVTMDNDVVWIHGYLLAALSPFLASLLSQVETDTKPCLSLPFTAPTIRGFLHQVLEGKDIMVQYRDLATLLGVTPYTGSKEDRSFGGTEGRVEVKKELDAMFTDKYEEISQEFEFSETNPLQEIDFKEPEPLQVSIKKKVSSFDNLNFICKMCSQKFLTRSKLRDHIDQCHTNYKPYGCDKCGESFKLKYQASIHIKTMHTYYGEIEKFKRPSEYKCPVCSIKYDNGTELRVHIRSHKDYKPFICDLCGYSFRQKAQLQAHERTSHYVEGTHEKYACTKCPRVVSTKYILAKHIDFVHGSTSMVSCSKCGKNLRQFSLKKHERLCQLSEEEKLIVEDRKAKKKVPCNLCGKTLANAVKLRRHVRFIHNMERLIKCNQCEYRDYRADNMKVHIRNNHPVENLLDSISSLERSYNKLE